MIVLFFLLLCITIGLFGTVRRHDVHCGVDIYCEMNTEVTCCEDGVVTGIHWLTGEFVLDPKGVPCTWWNNTMALMVEGDTGVTNYGEVDPSAIFVEVGEKVKKGQVIAKVIRPVLKGNKGRPMVMLHLEKYEKGFRGEPMWWNVGEEKPTQLLDPLPFLLEEGPVASFELSNYDGKQFIDPSAVVKDSEYWKVWKK
jgi:murein DD-endopeptidase MepM/ murein hydrolase activator NlpD